MDLTQKKEHQIITQEKIDDLMRVTLNLPQADCPVAHYFGPGTYIRQVTFPAGVFAIGHKQRFEQMNIFLQGRLAMIQPDGSTKEIKAPMIFMGPPGQKMGIILETVTWLNVYPNPDDERDIDVLESRFLDKDGPWTEKEAIEQQNRIDDRQVDRDDFEKFLNEIEVSENDFNAFCKETQDYSELPEGFASVLTIRQSEIEGKGIFASWPFQQNTMIAPAEIDKQETIIERYLNHSKNPNAEYRRLINGDIYLFAIRDIAGCRGGDKGEEITIDYRKEAKRCQQLPQP